MNLREIASVMVPANRVYVVEYVYRQWVDKPDPSGFGKCRVIYRDPSAAHEAALNLQSKGHKVVGIHLENAFAAKEGER